MIKGCININVTYEDIHTESILFVTKCDIKQETERLTLGLMWKIRYLYMDFDLSLESDPCIRCVHIIGTNNFLHKSWQTIEYIDTRIFVHMVLVIIKGCIK